jgi:hypothetical protein
MVRPTRTAKGAVRLLATALVLACAATIFVCHMRGWGSRVGLANQLRTSFAAGAPPREPTDLLAHVAEAAKTQEEQDIPSATTKKSMPEPREVPQGRNPACVEDFCTTDEDCCVGFHCWSVNEVESNNGQCVTDAQYQRMYRDYMEYLQCRRGCHEDTACCDGYQCVFRYTPEMGSCLKSHVARTPVVAED